MDPTVRLFPMHQLPPDFGRTLDDPPDPPATPRPAATLVLLRNRGDGMETLLLKRSRRMGFIPGAYVFPGGGVDRKDGLPDLLPHLSGLSPDAARTRLGVQEGEADAGTAAAPPPIAFFVAALRETFEETGILVGLPPKGFRTIPTGGGSLEGEVRARLLDGSTSFRHLLEELAVNLDAASLRYIGHWVTPEPEPRRYDTRFFAVEVPGDCRAEPYRGEVEEAIWLTPAEALLRNRSGLLPLVFPTLRTLEDLEPFKDATQALAHFEGRRFPPLLPRLVRKPRGIEITLDDPA